VTINYVIFSYPFFKAWERVLVAREEEVRQLEAVQAKILAKVG
jgi:hypothetical protein